MENVIKISVVICAYNAEKFIGTALDSVINQEFPPENVEIILIDDGSTDATAKIVQERYAGRVKYFYRNNGGHTAAVNTALEKIKGDYVCFLDADDYWDKNKLREVFELFESDKEIDVIYNYLRRVDEFGKTLELEPNLKKLKPEMLSDDHLAECLAGRLSYAPPTSGISVRSACLVKLGKLPEKEAFPDIILRTILPFYARKIRFIKKHLHAYRIHANNTWENKPLTEKWLERDIAIHKELRALVAQHAQIIGFDAGLYLSRLDLEINKRRIIYLRMKGKIFSALWLVATRKFPIFGRYRHKFLYSFYSRINMFAHAILSHQTYSKFHAAYARTGLFKKIHGFLG